MASPEPSYPTTSSLAYFNTAENDLKSNLRKIIESFKEEMKKKIRKTQTSEKMNKTFQDLKNGNRCNKENTN